MSTRALALLLIGLGTAAPLQAQPALEIQAPDKLVLGQDTAASVRYRAGPSARPRLLTNVGSLATPQQIEPGLWQVEYRPPTQKYPQVAILVLLDDADESLFAWARIPLHGVASVELRSDPDVQVEVLVAGTPFGPARTDSRGRVAIGVVVPPGVSDALSIATDALGNQRKQRIPIGVPEFARVMSVCSPSGAPDFHVFAVDPRGAPDSHAQLDAPIAPLAVRAIAALDAGVYRVDLQFPDALRAGDVVQLSAQLRDHPSFSHGCSMRVPLERPDRLDVALSRPRFTAGETEAVKVRITPHYKGTREPEAAELHFDATFGQLSQARARSSGPVELTWTVPANFAGRSQASLRVRAGSVSASGSLALSPAQPSALKLVSEDEQLMADGASSTTLVLEARDPFGNPVQSARFRSAALGAVSEFRSVKPGQFEATYHSPRELASEDRVRVHELGTGITTQHAIRLRRLRGLYSLAVRAGYMTNFARISAPLLQLQAGYRLPFWRERLQVGFELGFYASSQQSLSLDAADRVRTTVQGMPILLRVAYLQQLGALELWPFVAGGVLFGSIAVRSPSSGDASTTDQAPMFAAGGGGSLSVGPGRALIELSWIHAPVRNTIARGNASGLSAGVGYLLEL